MADAATGPATSGRPCRVALLGFGTVGQAVARLVLARHSPPLELAVIFNRQVDRKRAAWVPSGVRWTDRVEDAIAADVDVVVEVVGGIDPAGGWVRRALEAGKPVVTANKQLVAEQGTPLLRLAREKRVALRFEASVAGGVPVVRAIQDGIGADRLVRVVGIVNGTCNYILTRLEAGGTSFAEALEDAQQLGFAEADPRADIDGLDARAKLAILARLAFDCDLAPDAIRTASISHVTGGDFEFAREGGCTIRQIAWLERGADGDAGPVTAWVSPALVPLASAFARVQGGQNIVAVQGEYGGETTLVGLGAGGDPTAVAVVSDLLAVAQSPGQHAARAVAPRCDATDDFVSRRYLRVATTSRQAVAASLRPLLARHGLVVDDLLDASGAAGSALAAIVEACSTGSMERAVAELMQAGHAASVLTLPIVDLEPAGSKAEKPAVELSANTPARLS